MAATTFSGPLKAGTVRDTTGTALGSVANVGYVLMAQSGAVVFGANNSTTTVATLPPNSQIVEIITDTTTAFNAATTNTFDIGDGSTSDQFADALAIGSVGRVLASTDASQLTNWRDVGANGVKVVVTYNQTGTAATTGAATVTVLYLQDRNLV